MPNFLCAKEYKENCLNHEVYVVSFVYHGSHMTRDSYLPMQRKVKQVMNPPVMRP
jgi:hypothetical protein